MKDSGDGDGFGVDGRRFGGVVGDAECEDDGAHDVIEGGFVQVGLSKVDGGVDEGVSGTPTPVRSFLCGVVPML